MFLDHNFRKKLITILIFILIYTTPHIVAPAIRSFKMLANKLMNDSFRLRTYSPLIALNLLAWKVVHFIVAKWMAFSLLSRVITSPAHNGNLSVTSFAVGLSHLM